MFKNKKELKELKKHIKELEERISNLEDKIKTKKYFNQGGN